jgi:hypothetical protein
MYTIKVYVGHGYFSYNVDNMASAIEHAEAIMEKGTYRSSNNDDSVTIYKVNKVKVCGEGLKSEYPDNFHRT